MKDSIERISGNAFTVILSPESQEERCADSKTIGPYYYKAIRNHLGVHIKPASVTQDQDNPFRATVELLSEIGSV